MNYWKPEELTGGMMVIVPHQDDEVLLYGGVLYEAKRRGQDVKVVIVTNGDCDCRDHTKGQDRLRESIKGMGKLGIPESDLIFLGYADTGMPKEDSFLGRLYEEKRQDKKIVSACSDKTYALPEKPDYHAEKFGEHALYTRKMVEQDLKSVLTDYKPKYIFTTCEEDTHGDHTGLYLFLREILRQLRTEKSYDPEVFCGLVHSAAGDEFWPERDGAGFTCPKDFDSSGNLRWDDRYCFALPEELTRKKGVENLKYQALLQYETALEPSAYEFLMSFVKDEEIFWKMAE